MLLCFVAKLRERIIVPPDWHFVVYTGGASVDEAAGVDEGVIFLLGNSVH